MINQDFTLTQKILDENSSCTEDYFVLFNILSNRGNEKSFDTSVLSNHKFENIGIELLSNGFYHFYNSESSKAIPFFDKAISYSKKNKKPALQKLALLGYIDLYTSSNTLNLESFKEYETQFRSIISTPNEQVLIDFYSNLFELKSTRKDKTLIASTTKQFFNTFYKYKSQINPGLKPIIYNTIGQNHRLNKQTDSAIAYLNEVVNSPNRNSSKLYKYQASLGLIDTYTQKGDTLNANNAIESAFDNIPNNDSLSYAITLKKFIAHYHLRPLKKFENAYQTLFEANSQSYQLELEKNNRRISELFIELKTAEKEKELVVAKAENESQIAQKKRIRNILYGLTGFLILGSVIAVLLQRNTKRKQRIAEQEKELEIQKTEKILKEKEIETINAMVSGQEKERHRLAGELHDNLGSTLATVRMQVENLERNLDKVDNPKALLTKTNTLINEAYEKVRKISHERNAGVLAKDGLLPAINKLARSVSNNSLSVSIEEFGLDNRFSNESEITIFRIIQELVTNAIKHANASEITISLTQHERELNIMVEDDGIGFTVGKLQRKEGMGLGSIERRVEHLEGTMEVDSSPGNGTNIIIDIPL